MKLKKKSRYDRALPFNVLVKIQNELLEPEITLDITLPDELKGEMSGTVDAELARLRRNQNELNKQAFGLLTMSQFLPREGSGRQGPNLAGSARSSASEVLTEQLNRLSSKYFGNDLQMKVESRKSASDEGQTEFDMKYSRRLFNDRMNISLGGDVELEGEAREKQQLSDIAGDIEVEYQLTKDGNYTIKAFRKEDYRGKLDGEITRTGVGLRYSRNFNRLKELFQRKNEGE